ncbi:transport and Golgi organization protein 1 homolog [Microcebus murinus]|uniref:transport and Golgi organization protein 1 homolog n=1 Tax=Microcebus murinus TaxID=30608 RepID=UPI003F6B9457
MEMKKLIFWPLLLTAVCNLSAKTVHILPDDFQHGPDFLEIVWKCLFVTSFVGSATFDIFFRRTIRASGDVKDKLEDSNLRAQRSKIIMKLQKNCSELGNRKGEKENKIRMLQMEVDNRYEMFRRRAAAVAE